MPFTVFRLKLNFSLQSQEEKNAQYSILQLNTDTLVFRQNVGKETMKEDYAEHVMEIFVIR